MRVDKIVRMRMVEDKTKKIEKMFYINNMKKNISDYH